jgi:hypothetical protein
VFLTALAARCLTAAILLRPGSVEGRRVSAERALADGEYDLADREFSPVLAAKPDQQAVWVRLRPL